MVPRRFGWTIEMLLAATLLAWPSRGWCEPPLAQLLPAGAKAALIVDDMPLARERLAATQIAALANDPAMKPFADQVQGNLRKSISDLESDLGLTADEVFEAAQQSLCAALTENSLGAAVRILLIRTGQRQELGPQLIDAARRRLSEQGRQAKKLQADGITLHVFQDADKTVVYFHAGGLLGIVDDLDEAQACAARLAGRGEATLAGNTEYQNISKRLAANHAGGPPHLTWFVEPVGLAQLLYTPELGDDERDEPAAISDRHGLDAVAGLGGTVMFGVDDYDMLYRVAISARRPFRSTMAMFDFVTSNDFAPPNWAPDQVSSFTTIYWRVPQIGKHVGLLFDDLIGDGIEGTFDSILKGLEADDGPGVDLQAEVMERIGPQIHHMSSYVLPAGPTSEYSVVAVRSQNEKQLEDTLDRLIGGDPSVRRTKVYDTLLFRLGEDSAPENAKDAKDGEGLVFTSSAMSATLGHLLIGSNYFHTRQMIRELRGAQRLAAASDFQGVQRRLEQLGGRAAFLRVFARLRRDFYTTYELMRRGQLEQAESIYAQLITMLIDPDNKETEIDFSLLPEFEHVSKYIGYTGIYGQNQDDGWLLVGFLLPGQP